MSSPGIKSHIHYDGGRWTELKGVIALPSSIDIPPMVELGWNAYAQMGVAEVTPSVLLVPVLASMVTALTYHILAWSCISSIRSTPQRPLCRKPTVQIVHHNIVLQHHSPHPSLRYRPHAVVGQQPSSSTTTTK